MKVSTNFGLPKQKVIIIMNTHFVSKVAMFE
jgi:hypothetical protein